MRLYHITTFDRERQVVLRPRVPENTLASESSQIERICFSDSIKGCIFGLGQCEILKDADKIWVYEIEVSPDDDALICPQNLYNRGLVDDALLSNEFWYLKPILVKKYYEYALYDIKTRKYIIVPATESLYVKIFLDREHVDYKTEENLLNVINCEIDEKMKQELKEFLTIEKEQEIVSEEIYRQIFHEKRVKSYDDYEYRYQEYKYIYDCNLTKISEKVSDNFILTPCNYTELQKIVKTDAFQLYSWKLIKEEYVWNNDTFLYKVVNQENEIIAMVYYYLHKDKVFISCLEVVESYRSAGIGERVVEILISENNFDKENIIVEPLSEDAARFWNRIGINCSYV